MGPQKEERRTISTVLVAGDNRLSSAILRVLSETTLNLVQIIASKSSPQPGTRVQQHTSDLSTSSLSTIFSQTNPDLLISTHAGGSFDTQRRLIDTALATGVPRFLADEFAHDSLNEAVQARLPPHAERARVIQYLRHVVVGAVDPDISWSAVATGLTLDRDLLDNADMGVDLKWQSATVHGTGEESFAASSLDWIGGVVLAIIRNWDRVCGRYLYAAGLVTCTNALLAEIHLRTGHEFEVGRGTVQECISEGERRLDMGFVDAGMLLLRRSVLYDGSLRAVEPFVLQDAKGTLGLRGEMLGDIVERVVHESRRRARGECGCG